MKWLVQRRNNGSTNGIMNEKNKLLVPGWNGYYYLEMFSKYLELSRKPLNN